MARLPRSVARTRTAVRRSVADLPDGALIMVACSGGPDSMALAAATAFVAPRRQLRCGFVTVDHGLQDDSAKRAAEVAEWARYQGFDPVEVVTVEVDPSDGGPEAAARDVRYAALEDCVQRNDAGAVLLGHTRDDQAETVLLALARGAGPRGIAGMAPVRGVFRRPLLELTRADTETACADLGLDTWDDPHNTDSAYTRSRLRQAMPLLTDLLGPGLVGNLARTASLVAADTAVLDRMAAQVMARATGGSPTLSVSVLAGQPEAVRTRVLHRWARLLGTPGSDLSHQHVTAMDALVSRWRGQGPVQLPGGVEVRRADGQLVASLSGTPPV